MTTVATTAEAGVVRWVRSVLAAFDGDPIGHTVRVILADAKAPKPTPPYATVKTLADVSRGEPDVWTSDTMQGDQAEQLVIRRQHDSMSIQTFGPRHHEMARALELSLWSDTTRAALADDGLVVDVTTRPRRIVVPLDTGRDTRSLLEVRVGYVETRTQLVDVLETLATDPTLAPAS